jgi:DNA-binding NarL/FixJ family response regulator
MENATQTLIRVFIVEDSVPIRERLTELLATAAGISVVGHAGTADAAIAGILGTRADSVVLDINLIGGSGLEVLKSVRKSAPDTVFVVLTNTPTSQYRAVFLNAGAQAFLDKTTEFEKVPAAVIAGTANTPRHVHG